MGEYVNMIRNRFLDAQRKISAVEEKANKEVDKEANKYAAQKLSPEIEEGIKSQYIDAVTAWYGAYEPKKYQRTNSLYDVMKVKETDGIFAGWEYYDDGLTKPSLWGGTSFNIYDLVFEGGSHGGPLPMYHYIPPKSTPIPKLFEANERAYRMHNQAYFKKKYLQIGDEYFNANAYSRVKQRIREAYGSEFDWLIG